LESSELIEENIDAGLGPLELGRGGLERAVGGEVVWETLAHVKPVCINSHASYFDRATEVSSPVLGSWRTIQSRSCVAIQLAEHFYNTYVLLTLHRAELHAGVESPAYRPSCVFVT
jgi:hypothetical protein